MSLILNIDTAVQSASLCLAQDYTAIDCLKSAEQKEQASWLHVSVQQLLEKNQKKPADLSAIAVSAGPGSYTGLRVSMAAAKGLCYILNIPLILVNTLEQMVVSAGELPVDLYCPMIDARRMEVFTALYFSNLVPYRPPSSLILDSASFSEEISSKKIAFFGNGSKKFAEMADHPNAIFKDVETNAQHMAVISYNKFQAGDFADLAYSEPWYGKDFYSTVK